MNTCNTKTETNAIEDLLVSLVKHDHEDQLASSIVRYIKDTPYDIFVHCAKYKTSLFDLVLNRLLPHLQNSHYRRMEKALFDKIRKFEAEHVCDKSLSCRKFGLRDDIDRRERCCDKCLHFKCQICCKRYKTTSWILMDIPVHVCDECQADTSVSTPPAKHLYRILRRQIKARVPVLFFGISILSDSFDLTVPQKALHPSNKSMYELAVKWKRHQTAKFISYQESGLWDGCGERDCESETIFESPTTSYKEEEDVLH